MENNQRAFFNNIELEGVKILKADEKKSIFGLEKEESDNNEIKFLGNKRNRSQLNCKD